MNEIDNIMLLTKAVNILKTAGQKIESSANKDLSKIEIMKNFFVENSYIFKSTTTTFDNLVEKIFEITRVEIIKMVDDLKNELEKL
jgi:hypothetical protein